MSEGKPTFMVAGPGAGKTHGMVDLITLSLSDLQPHRQLAAITYTNAAADIIRRRLSKRVTLPQNVFIGTTHSFVNRFILQPFGTVFEKLPAERIFSAIDIDGPPAKRNAILKNLRKKGVVSYSTMLSVAAELMSQKRIRGRVTNRLQFLFVDESQDIDNQQYKIFAELQKNGSTHLYFVGDPEQYISGHTYRNSGRSIPEFTELPFMKLHSACDVTMKTVNRRANGELVSFANQFRDDIEQVAQKPGRGKCAVVFLRDTNLSDIVKQFQEITAGVRPEGERLARLYLAKANSAFDDVRHRFEIIHVSNQSRKTPTLLGDACDLLAQAVGFSENRAMREFKISRLFWRGIAIRVLRGCREGTFDEAALWDLLKRELKVEKSGSRSDAVARQMADLKAIMATKAITDSDELSSSIHRAKGLEADVVLVLARTETELASWLVKEPSKRMTDKSDNCRLGYVAVTRAREMVCFACLKGIGKGTMEVLEACGIAASNDVK